MFCVGLVLQCLQRISLCMMYVYVSATTTRASSRRVSRRDRGGSALCELEDDEPPETDDEWLGFDVQGGLEVVDETARGNGAFGGGELVGNETRERGLGLAEETGNLLCDPFASDGVDAGVEDEGPVDGVGEDVSLGRGDGGDYGGDVNFCRRRRRFQRRSSVFVVFVGGKRGAEKTPGVVLCFRFGRARRRPRNAKGRRNMTRFDIETANTRRFR
jgi:hypothetical protein